MGGGIAPDRGAKQLNGCRLSSYIYGIYIWVPEVEFHPACVGRGGAGLMRTFLKPKKAREEKKKKKNKLPYTLHQELDRPGVCVSSDPGNI